MRKILKQNFFERAARDVARDLLGKYLVRKIKNRETALMITETEAYDGPHDMASHAHKGKTARTEVMFGPAGYFYVYLCYGMHFMLNIVTGPKDYPAAVLIRGAILQGPTLKYVNGPGKLTRYFKIDKKLNAISALSQSGLWFEDRGVNIRKSQIRKTPRIGVSYAGEWAQKHYRFVFIPKQIPADIGRKI